MQKTQELLNIADRLRLNILESTTKSGSGHPTSSLSSVEVLAELVFNGHLKYDFDNPKYIFNDRLIFSKGHAAPLLYSIYEACGVISRADLLSLRQFGSDFEGHPTPRIKWVDVATGSLGQGLSVGLGMALGINKHLAGYKENIIKEPRVFVLLGDSEMAEGQIWEAMQIASYYKVRNLIAIVDVNRLGQRGETMLSWDIDAYVKRAEAFSWDTATINNGNDALEVATVFKNKLANTTLKKPLMIFAKTKKGAGVSFFEDKDSWHGKPLPESELETALKNYNNLDTNIIYKVAKPEKINTENTPNKLNFEFPRIPELMATREAYGEGLKMLSVQNNLVVLDAETSNSTFAEKIKETDNSKFYEMFIAEQNMVSVGLGMSKLGFNVYLSSFAAFLTRAFDQIRMARYSQGNLKIAGSHAGVSIGVDGSSQMAIEDIAMARSVLDSVVIYPADGTSTIKLLKALNSYNGISYLRLTREKTPKLYTDAYDFYIGGSHILKQSSKDTAVVFTAGITLFEALNAHKQLLQEGVNICVVDLYSIKPLDKKTVLELTNKIKNVVVVEDHGECGGIGEAVLQALAGTQCNFKHLAVRKNPRSGKMEELLSFENIDTASIVKAVKDF